MHRLCLVLLVAAVTLPARADDAALKAALATLRAAKTDDERTKAIDGVTALGLAPDALAQALAAAPLAASGTYFNVEAGWQIMRVDGSDGVNRPWHLYVPAGYAPGTPHGVLFQLHGGVSQPDVPDEERLTGMHDTWEREAAGLKVLIAIPTADDDSEWWDPVGMGNILSILGAIKAAYDIDPNRVHLSGFSDGASGTLHFALHHATPFASFVALSGHVAVSQASGKPVYLHNLLGKSLYVVNGGKDQLYPADTVAPFVQAMKQAGANVTNQVHPDAGHDPGYLAVEMPRLVEYLKTTVRAPHPDRLAFETIEPGASARNHWIVVDKLGFPLEQSDLPDINLLVPPKLQLGIGVDQAFAGPGVKITGAADGTAAQRAGLRKDDVLTRADGREITNLEALRAVLATKKWDDTIDLVIQRGTEKVELKATFTKGLPRNAFDRKGSPGRVEAHREGQRITVRTRGVLAFTLLLGVGAFEVGKPIELVVNGKAPETITPTFDARLMLGRYAQDQDRAMLYWGAIAKNLASASGD